MKKFTLGEILNSQYSEPPCLIESLVWEQDNIIVLGSAKTSKSVLAQQLTFSASAGEDFLDQLKVYKKCKIAYFQAEGKMPETISRCKRMAKEVPCVRDNVLWLHVPGIAMNRPETCIDIIKKELGTFRPDIMIFDPLYKLKSGGSLKDDEVAGAITTSLDILKSIYDCAVIIVHHEHRIIFDKESGKLREEGDNAIFGSFVWQAWPDHILLLRKMPREGKNARELTCNTQRSEKVIKKLRLTLLEPDPLLFEVAEDTQSAQKRVLQYLAKQTEAIHYTQISEKCSLAISTVQKALRQLCKENVTERLDAGFYKLKEES